MKLVLITWRHQLPEVLSAKMMIFLVLLIFFINVEAIPHSLDRVTRALPPKYLSVQGFQNCMVNYALETSSHWCFPLEKIPGCPTETWNELGEAYKPQRERPNMVGGLGGLPPAYLQVRILY